MKKFLLIFFLIFLSCSSNELDVYSSPLPDNNFTPATTEYKPTPTTSTTIPIQNEFNLSINCTPEISDDILSFAFTVSSTDSRVIAVNIVMWFEHQRTEDILIDNNDIPLPFNNQVNTYLYDVEKSKGTYEIEMVAMDENQEFSDDYCLYESR